MAAAASGKQVNKTSRGFGDNPLLNEHKTSRHKTIGIHKVTWHCALGAVVEARRYTKLSSTSRLREDVRRFL